MLINTSLATVSSPAISEVLAGKRVALIGLDPEHESELMAVLEEQDAFCRRVALAGAGPDSTVLRAYDLLILQASAELDESGWLSPEGPEGPGKPVIVVGAAPALAEQMQALQQRSFEFLATPCGQDDLIMRVYGVLLRPEKQAEGTPGKAGPRKDPLVLVADDDSSVCTLVRAVLEKGGMRCQVATDGKQGLEKAQEFRPDILLLDVNMPHMDGFQVLAALRADDRNRLMRIVLLTGREQESDVVRGFGLGADDYIVKPFNPMELLARLKRLVA